MAKQIGPMQLLISIVEHGKGAALMEQYRKFKLVHHNRTVGRGTAASHLLDALGFGTTERDVIFTFGPQDTMRQLMYYLKDEDRPSLNAAGIAFSLNLSGMSSILAVCLSRLEEMEPERGEQIVGQQSQSSLILVTVNQGYTDAVMDTARAAGARGGTVLRVRWTGAGEVEKFVGITIQEEKEVLAIVAHRRERNAIMEEIERTHGLRTAAQATVISLPIEQTARLD